MEINTQTIEDICRTTGTDIDTMRRRWVRKIGSGFNRYAIPTSEQLSVLLSDNRTSKKVRTQTDNPNKDISGQNKSDNTQKPEQGHFRTKQGGKNRQEWPLYVVMIFAAGTTVPNMYDVTMSIKGSAALAWLFTACFTAAPFLLLYAGVKGIAGKIGVGLIILIEIFCNTTGIYGGLTGLNHSNFTTPTNFLHMATGFAFDSAYEPTARAIALFMALGVAVLMVISVDEIRKIEAEK